MDRMDGMKRSGTEAECSFLFGAGCFLVHTVHSDHSYPIGWVPRLRTPRCALLPAGAPANPV